MPQQPSIAIVGAGPGGLTAANVLHRAGWTAMIFDADRSAAARDQGGTLDLHPDDGQLALAKAGLFDAFLAVARHEDQGNRVLDHATGEVLRDVAPPPGSGDRPEIDRAVLRDLLLSPLATDAVRWGSSVEAATTLPDGRHALRLSDGKTEAFDLVIGADGAWSRVRAALTDTRPAYTGVAFVELWMNDVDRVHAASAALVGRGTMFALHDGQGIIAQRNGNATLRIYAAFRTRAEDTDRPDRTLAGIGTNDLLRRFEGWSPALRSLLADADRIAAVRPIVALPVDLRWTGRDGLTLIGDAAHVMPPLGVGVNLAMLDAAELAETLVAGQDWREAVRTYEAAMIARAEPIAADCTTAFARMFGPDGAQMILDDFDSHADG
ncbi:MAG: FAD-dependent oxidoreductase [Janthinobacterium lividum]